MSRVLPHVNVGIRVRDASLALWLERMMACFGDVRDCAVLDFGSGSGHKAILLALCGARVIAVEPDEAQSSQIRQAAERIGVEVEILAGGLERLSELGDATCDRILLAEVIEHLAPEGVRRLRGELARLLRPGGKIFLTTPNRVVKGPVEESPEYYRRTPFGHHQHFTLAELRDLFDRPPFHLANYVFETHPLTLARHRIFYPLARFDYTVQNTRRFPLLRLSLLPASALIYFSLEVAFPLLYGWQTAYEARRASDEDGGMTIMIEVERA
ncbi:MAG: class I SAM-dependent methyltransferase [Chloroflexi bacterium]|nr:class I SAM-dependent methyltransferase [Chloroflexota bacterium]